MTAAQSHVASKYGGTPDYGVYVTTFRDEFEGIMRDRDGQPVLGFTDRILKVRCAMDYFGAWIS